MAEENLDDVLNSVNEISLSFPQKTIWLYSGYTWEEIMEYIRPFNNINTASNDKIIYDHHMWKRQQIIKKCNVLVDGRYIDAQKDIALPYRGSKNQRLINIQKSLQKGEIVLWQI